MVHFDRKTVASGQKEEAENSLHGQGTRVARLEWMVHIDRKTVVRKRKPKACMGTRVAPVSTGTTTRVVHIDSWQWSERESQKPAWGPGAAVNMGRTGKIPGGC